MTARRLKTLGLLAAPLPAIAALALTTPAHAVAQPQVALRGDVVSAISHSVRTGAVASSTRLNVTVSLAMRDQAGLRAFLAQVTDPHSAQYKHYLTVSQFAARYGAGQATVNEVTGYLKSQGLHVGQIAANHLSVTAAGSAQQVEKAFGTSLATYHDAGVKRDFFANTTAPKIPAAFAADVVDVSGLDNFAAHRHFNHVNTAVRPNATAPVAGLDPTSGPAAYDLASLQSSGDNGTGVTVGLVEFSAFSQSDISTYDSTYGLNVSAPTVVNVDGGTTDTSGQDEVDLDIEVIQALAPGATIKVYEAPNSTAGDEALYSQLASDKVPVVSSSWGQAESQIDAANRTADDQSLQEAAAQGQSVYAASGDNGSDDAGDGGTSVDFPASDPSVSGVGGTTLSTNSDGSYGGETAWSGSGGGTSTVFTQPSYQSGVTSDTNRDVPDVAAAADPSTGWAVYTGGQWEEVGGTSGAAPNWAAFTAIYDQVAAAKGHAAFGNANSTIYADAGGSNYANDFHDVTSGSNGAFSAGTGYDEVTGWGSYDGAKFISDNLG
ncbi:protease pro-enzyme activation domain-containing protein [Streptacidiphilus sp. MAP5-3]|uniref:S53 family peptidase n=1 Tax=unclassified Streptacidiphilus TaxID=2643834 RepID=UPI003515C6B9